MNPYQKAKLKPHLNSLRKQSDFEFYERMYYAFKKLSRIMDQDVLHYDKFTQNRLKAKVAFFRQKMESIKHHSKSLQTA